MRVSLVIRIWIEKKWTGWFFKSFMLLPWGSGFSGGGDFFLGGGDFYVSMEIFSGEVEIFFLM